MLDPDEDAEDQMSDALRLGCILSGAVVFGIIVSIIHAVMH